jgi:hypothetical protein
MSEGIPEYAVPESESGYLLENAIYCSPVDVDIAGQGYLN